MKGFNSMFFLICSIVLAVVAYESYLQAVALDEGRAGNSTLRLLVADMFNVMRFPLLMIFKGWARRPLNFSIGLIVNCLIYSFLLERIVYFIFRPKVEDDTN